MIANVKDQEKVIRLLNITALGEKYGLVIFYERLLDIM